MEKKRFYELAIANYEERQYGGLQVFIAVKNVKIGDEYVWADVIISEDMDVSTTYRDCKYLKKTLDKHETERIL